MEFKMKKESVVMRNHTSVEGDAFDLNDFKKIQEIFKKWLEINKMLNDLEGRKLNVPDVFSEALFSLAFNAVRTNNTAHSYDCVLRKTGEGIQVKSASIANDCTSFGPTSTWDLLYFADFAPNGGIDGVVKFYKIEDEWVYNLVLNQSKNETFKQQQEQRRRPRFSMQNKIIRPRNLKPEKTVNIITGEGITDILK
jgi:hypothetical protein